MSASDLTPDALAELRRRHAALTPFALRFLSNGPGGEPFIALACEDGTPLPEPAFDAVLLFAELAAAELPALLDAAAERDKTARLLAAETARVGDLTAERDAALALVSEHRCDVQAEAAYGRVLRLRAERDALAADCDALRAMLSGRCLSDITHRDEGADR